VREQADADAKLRLIMDKNHTNHKLDPALWPVLRAFARHVTKLGTRIDVPGRKGRLGLWLFVAAVTIFFALIVIFNMWANAWAPRQGILPKWEPPAPVQRIDF
jgi:heme/copper-type cytochrome/quinol oxidase subunit 3